MSNILAEILEATRSRVHASKSSVSLSDFRDFPAYSTRVRSLTSALVKRPMNIIAEIKRISPSAGPIRKNAEPQTISMTYEAAGAAAVSVLTEPNFFGGSLADMETVKRNVSLPVLRKDFIIDEYQVHEARAHGADAILLIVRALDKRQLSELHETATTLGLDVLVELYDKRELDNVNLDQVHIVGANNRDLSTMKVDLRRSIDILETLPSSIVRVSESGISTAGDIQTLIDKGIRAALVGESLMRQPDPGEHLKHLLRTDHGD